MKHELSKLLADWPYQPGQISARLVEDEGEAFIQVRLDLGLLHMQADGRPDGLRPDGYESALEAAEEQLYQPTQEKSSLDEAGETGAAAGLSGEQCKALREEAAQYYQRYVACLVLEDYERVIRDTTRNLRVIDLCAKHAQDDQDKVILEQFRPYIVMVRARAQASQAMRENETRCAVLAVDDALDTLKKHFEKIGKPALFEESSEVEMLREMRRALEPKAPVSEAAELQERLQRAVMAENYELAAILRDEIKMLRDRPKDAPKHSQTGEGEQPKREGKKRKKPE
jgi:protein-arginine kinase activator protein McsA